jgi:tricorn protease
MKHFIIALLFTLTMTALGRGEEKKPLLFQKPTVSRTHIVFGYAGDLWIVAREGGEAKRLTNGVGLEIDPIFSPDGTQVAFTGEYEGNLDVYVIPATGGTPRRLTYHPSIDMAIGWTPDGKQVLFRSDRSSYSRFNRLFTVPVEGGGLPTELPLPMGEEGSFSSDGSKLAYVPFWNRRSSPGGYISWKHYRGGKASPIWIANLADSKIEKIPRKDSNDSNPMWIGDKVYFLSDRDGPVSLYFYDLASKEVNRVQAANGQDILSASGGNGVIVYEQMGVLHELDLASGRTKPIDIRLSGDFPARRPKYEKVAKKIRSANISPTGVRAVFEARGEILTVPAEKGAIRNITQTPGVAERYPAWSPDGKWIAYFSDEPGEYQLHLRDQRALTEPKKFTLGDPPSFYYEPRWSPDSKKIAYTDKRHNIWILDIASGKSTRVDTNTYDTPFHSMNPAWSPDSRWLAYTKQLKSHLHAVFVYEVAKAQSHEITDGMSDARFAEFDKNGKYLYFTASTDAGPTTGWLDMSSYNRPVTRSVYIVVLGKDLPSPIAPESDEEKSPESTPPLKTEDETQSKKAEAKSAKSKDKKEKAEAKTTKSEDVKVRIDLENIGQRILALPIPARNYVGMETGKTGHVFLLEAPLVEGRFGENILTLQHFDLEKRKVEKLLEGINSFDLSHNGEKMLYRQGDKWHIASASSPPKPGDGLLKTDDMEVYVDPRAEWAQMYHEVWRIQRDFLYDPGYHGFDIKAAENKYRPYLDNIAARSDLNYLFNEMLGELTIGHLFIGGGDSPEIKPVPGGLLGADYSIENGRYRFKNILHGENWNPQLRAPLTQPGVNVKPGEYLIAVNGRNLTDKDNLYKFFEATANKPVVLKVSSKPDGAGAREVTVVPVESENGLRHRAWIEENRRKVDRMTQGRVAYLYLPNTSVDGYTNFNRYYFAQIGKEGAVVDERFNGGGQAADYIIDYLRRPLMNYWTTREGADFTTPLGSIFGPKAMIVNEFAGSGGDAMPWYFRRAKIGPLVGERTWGGLVGIYDYPQLIDGGFITAPRMAFWSPDGDWDVENHGVAPDVEADLDPHAVRAGHDPQLEKAVQIVMEELKKNPLPHHKKPAYPNYHGAGAKAVQTEKQVPAATKDEKENNSTKAKRK